VGSKVGCHTDDSHASTMFSVRVRRGQIEADSKLVPSWMLGQRDTRTATVFVSDLASRLRKRVQITTDGHRPYVEAVENAFGDAVDYSILQKLYGGSAGELNAILSCPLHRN
jgi:hypothetical protein